MHRLLHPRTHIPCQPLVGPDQGRPLPLYFRHQAAHFPPRIGRPRLAVWARRVEQGRRIIIGGLISSTLLSRIVTPVMYLLIVRGHEPPAATAGEAIAIP